MTDYNNYLVVVVLFILYITHVSSAPDKTLRFNERGKFKIVQFTDLHYGYDEKENLKTSIVQGKLHFFNLQQLFKNITRIKYILILQNLIIEVILDAEKPDLVIITGDLVSGYEWDHNHRGFFKYLWAKLVAPMDERNIRYFFFSPSLLSQNSDPCIS
jgi:predicted MPP superfamily phosphohydrolase